MAYFYHTFPLIFGYILFDMKLFSILSIYIYIFNVFYWLCYYSCPNFSLFTHLRLVSPFSPAILYLSSCLWVMHISSLATPFPILYFTSPSIFCTYEFILLDAYTFSSVLRLHPPSWKPSKWSPCLWFCSCSACFLGLFFRFSLIVVNSLPF